MKNELCLVIVSSRSIVVRTLSSLGGNCNREISGCTQMMRQTLIVRGNSVIFEHFREEVDEPRPVRVAVITEAIKKNKEIRTLTDKELRALAKMGY